MRLYLFSDMLMYCKIDQAAQATVSSLPDGKRRFCNREAKFVVFSNQMKVLTKEDSGKARGKSNSNSSALLFGLEKSNKKVWWKADDAMEHAAWVNALTECISNAPDEEYIQQLEKDIADAINRSATDSRPKSVSRPTLMQKSSLQQSSVPMCLLPMGERNSSIATVEGGRVLIKQGLNHTFKKFPASSFNTDQVFFISCINPGYALSYDKDIVVSRQAKIPVMLQKLQPDAMVRSGFAMRPDLYNLRYFICEAVGKPGWYLCQSDGKVFLAKVDENSDQISKDRYCWWQRSVNTSKNRGRFGPLNSVNHAMSSPKV